MTKYPIKISVIMPVYNCEKYLPEAIESILTQTYRDFELIMIDDGSTDGSGALLEEYRLSDERVMVYTHRKNQGIVAALNSGLNLARGKYIARMDADDISLPERFEKQFRYLELNKEIGVIGSGAQLIDGFGKPSSTIKFPETNSLILWSLFFFNPIIHPTVMARREIYGEAGGYSNDWHNAEDYDLWSRLAGQISFQNLSDVLLQLRKHESNITVSEFTKTITCSLEISRKLIESLLCNNYSLELIKVLWNFDEPRNLLNAPELLIKIFHRFIERPLISSEEEAYLKKDVAIRLTYMAIRHFRESRSLNVFLQAFRYHLIMPVIILGQSIGQKIKKHTNPIIYYSFKKSRDRHDKV